MVLEFSQGSTATRNNGVGKNSFFKENLKKQGTIIPEILTYSHSKHCSD